MLTEVVRELGRSMRYALDGWSRTARACCIIMVAGATAALFLRIRG